MPTKKKKKYNARFPPARIKKIMQTDDDVGKVAAAVPVVISRGLELFAEALLRSANSALEARLARTLTPSHLKEVIHSEPRFDFLKSLVSQVPDLQGEVAGGDGRDTPPEGVTSRPVAAAAQAGASHRQRIPRQLSIVKPRGRKSRKGSLDTSQKHKGYADSDTASGSELASDDEDSGESAPASASSNLRRRSAASGPTFASSNGAAASAAAAAALHIPSATMTNGASTTLVPAFSISFPAVSLASPSAAASVSLASDTVTALDLTVTAAKNGQASSFSMSRILGSDERSSAVRTCPPAKADLLVPLQKQTSCVEVDEDYDA